MATIDLLQHIGLNKYEAEAYYTLLTHGPLTSYEVGKYSQVPGSRSYEILERLLDWEACKQRHLSSMSNGNRVA
jgi:sugar-specific transcriptional regulator TrmB